MEKKDFKILLVYPNIPLMTVPPLSMGIFTSILKKEGYQVELFDTTPYINEDDGRIKKATIIEKGEFLPNYIYVKEYMNN